MQASPLVVRVSSTIRTHGVGASSTGLVGGLVVLLLLLLDLLGLTLALLVELLILGLDLRVAVLGLAAAAASTGNKLVYEQFDLLVAVGFPGLT